MKEKHEESMKRIEGKISDLSQQILSGTYEMGNRDAIELRNRTIPSVPSKHKQIIEKEQWPVEEPKSKPTKNEVYNKTLKEGETLDKFINKDSPFRRIKSQILNESNPHLPDYIKPSYPLNKKNPKIEVEVGMFKKFMEMLTVLQVNIPFCDAFEQISVYTKFMKELLNGKCKLKDDKNVELAENIVISFNESYHLN